MPTVSIIVPNYNYAQYIGNALTSIRAQTMRDWECIIIDDASTDDSVNVIKKYTRNDKRFRLIQHTTSRGISAARNSGLDAAQGEYIAFLDSDDSFSECALEMLLHLARSTNADMIGGQTMIVSDTFKFIPSKKPSYSIGSFNTSNNPSSFLLTPQNYNWCWIWRRIYKRSLIGDTRFLPEMQTFGDDLTFMLDICWQAKNITETSNISVFHRQHMSSVTAAEFSTKNFDWFPTYFAHIRKNTLDKYDTYFLRNFYQNTFRYLLLETLFRPKHLGQLQQEAKAVLIKSCKLIPLRYLTIKQKVLCWFLSCLK